MSSDHDRTSSLALRLRAAVPPIVVLAIAVGYLGIDVVRVFDEPVPSSIPRIVQSALVALQAGVLIFRIRAPTLVFAVIVLLDATLLGTSGGELGTGSLAVIFATYSLVRRANMSVRAVYTTIGVCAAVTGVVSTIAMIGAAMFALPVVLALVVARLLIQYGIPAGIAGYILARARLVQALRDRAELAERDRVRSIEGELAKVRTAMARELHDIAAHHLSGIIVGSQAASALVSTDPERTREMLRTVQRDARTTLADLRRTVGLLRSSDPDDASLAGQPAVIPSLARISGLVESAQGRSQNVELSIVGEPRLLGPLAETAGYRMVQESLANAARHAGGASCSVQVEFLAELVRITVENGVPSGGSQREPVPRSHPGFGISGMEERADLVGARLIAGPVASGGWRNVLEIPVEQNRSDS